jgi:hypothetical protein
MMAEMPKNGGYSGHAMSAGARKFDATAAKCLGVVAQIALLTISTAHMQRIARYISLSRSQPKSFLYPSLSRGEVHPEGSYQSKRLRILSPYIVFQLC